MSMRNRAGRQVRQGGEGRPCGGRKGLEDGAALAGDGQRRQGSELEGPAGEQARAQPELRAAGQGPQRCAGGERPEQGPKGGGADGGRFCEARRGTAALAEDGERPRSRGESRAAEAAVAEHWALVGSGWTRALDRGEIAQSLQS